MSPWNFTDRNKIRNAKIRNQGLEPVILNKTDMPQPFKKWQKKIRLLKEPDIIILNDLYDQLLYNFSNCYARIANLF